MVDIFISYAQEERKRVTPLVRALEAQGCSVFWDMQVPAGKDWRDALEDKLDEARSIVVVWTEISIKRRWVREEAEEALTQRKYLPVRLDDVRVPLGFRGIQVADLARWDGSANSPILLQVLKDIRQHIGSPCDGSPPPPRPPQWPLRAALLGALAVLTGAFAFAVLFSSLSFDTNGCDLRLMVASDGNTDDEMIRKFKTEFESKKQECAVLIVRATSDSEKWTIAGFSDAGEFRTVVIDDSSHELSEELKKESINKSGIVGLATSSLSRTHTNSGRPPTPKPAPIPDPSKREGKSHTVTCEDAKLEHKDLTRLNLAGKNCFRANLRNSVLRGVDLTHTKFEHADLSGADLSHANLEGAKMRRANLRGTILTDTRLSGADLRGANNLTQEQLDQACGDKQTRLPGGLTIGPCG